MIMVALSVWPIPQLAVSSNYFLSPTKVVNKDFKEETHTDKSVIFM